MPFKFSYRLTFLFEVDMTEKMWLKKAEKPKIYILVFVYVHMRVCI